MSNNLVSQHSGVIEALLARPQIQQRFREMLGQRAPQFISSVIQVYRGFTQPVDPSSVIASAAIAATLDLPIEKNLGFAHIVPYAGQAQFQMGYRGYVQLALRSGQYRNMNACRVNEEAYKGRDEIGEPVIDWNAIDDSKDAVGYIFAWRLVSGFTKAIYWTRQEVEAHAKKYSQAFKKQKQDSPWFTNFDAMALKTIISNSLRRWGILSVQLQKALQFDQAVVKDLDAEPQFIDEGQITLPETTGNQSIDPEKPIKTKPESKEDQSNGGSPQDELAYEVVSKGGYTFDDFTKWAVETGQLTEAQLENVTCFDELDGNFCKRMLRAKVGLLKGLAMLKGAAQ